MPTKNDIIGNVLLSELIAIRTDTLWRMLGHLHRGQLPDPNEEGATGKLDNKGAIFIPGGLIYQDVDEKEIVYQPVDMDEDLFREKIRNSLNFDNATLLFPDGVVNSVNLDTGFYTKANKRIYTVKAAAFKRIRRISYRMEQDMDVTDIIRSHCPPYVDPPYGSRTRISTCLTIGLTDPHIYFAYCKTESNLSKRRLLDFAQRLDSVLAPPEVVDGKPLFPPYIVVCHDTRYKDNSLTGLIRILGVGRFGEFCTLTFERLDSILTAELNRKEIPYGEEHVFAEYDGVQAVCVLRIYDPTNPGKRSLKYDMHLVSAEKDVDIDLEGIRRRAWERYQIKEIVDEDAHADNPAGDSAEEADDK